MFSLKIKLQPTPLQSSSAYIWHMFLKPRELSLLLDLNLDVTQSTSSTTNPKFLRKIRTAEDCLEFSLPFQLQVLCLGHHYDTNQKTSNCQRQVMGNAGSWVIVFGEFQVSQCLSAPGNPARRYPVQALSTDLLLWQVTLCHILFPSPHPPQYLTIHS